MKRFVVALAVLVAVLIPAGLAQAGSPHFVGTPLISSSGDEATASGKVAGLGNEPSIFVIAVGEAECVNRGHHNPEAANKDEVSAFGLFPVQNGKALFTELLEADFQPDCSPPMTVSWDLLAIRVYTGCDSVATCTDQFLILSYP
jgi:hypothetical protein